MRVLFFAQLKDLTQCDFIEFSVSTPLKIDEFWAMLIKQFPLLAPHRSSVRLAKNLEYTGPETQFSNQDEIALIPPVSGG